MTNEEIRIVIAEACGWKDVRELNYVVCGYPPAYR